MNLVLLFQVNDYVLQKLFLFSILSFFQLYSGEKMSWNRTSGGSGRNFALPAMRRCPGVSFFSHHTSIILELVLTLTFCSVFLFPLQEKERALNLAVDVFCRLVKQHSSVAQLVAKYVSLQLHTLLQVFMLLYCSYFVDFESIVYVKN
jgi:hypothetical protein